MAHNSYFFDDSFAQSEQLPREFTLYFKSIDTPGMKAVQVFMNETVQLGDIIDDNSFKSDNYRFHDIFHYTFATLLGWSPCARALIKCKRKSNFVIDKIEDGARAAVTEEAISVMIFNEAQKRNFYHNNKSVSKYLLKIIKEITEPYEVRTRAESEWELAILEGYKIFRKLVEHDGGRVYFNSYNKEIIYLN